MPLVAGTIWHLSDLHFQSGLPAGDPDARVHIPGAQEGEWPVDAQQALFYFIDSERRRLPDGATTVAQALVISGDLVHQSGWSNVDRVRDLIERIRVALGLEQKHVLVVPGNHDVNLIAALSHPELSRDEFVRATRGYTTADARCNSAVFPDEGLAFVLADTVAHVGEPVNLPKAVTALKVRFPSIDAIELGEVLRDVLATEVPSISTAAIVDALNEIAGVAAEVTQTARRGGMAAAALPPHLLGFLISHYPLLPCPFTNVEVKQFHLPIASGPVKSILSKAGIHLCLHGHQHVAWTHSEKTASGPRETHDVRFTCIGAGSLTQDDKSFNIIRYALMTDTGEARVTVQPMSVALSGVTPGEFRRIHVPPRVGPSARAIRLVERIGADGMVRSDVWYSDVSTSNWRAVRAGSKARVLALPVLVETDQGGPLRLATQELTEGFEIEFVPAVRVEKDDGGSAVTAGPLRGQLKLSTKTDTLERVSFAYRTFSHFAYCASVQEKARCFGGERVVPDLGYDEEALVHVVRVPCERLELYLHTPHEAPLRKDLRLFTCIESDDGTLVPIEGIANMTDYTIESWPKARRVRLVVPRPMARGAYGIAWKLDAHAPGHHSDASRTSLLAPEIERLRERLATARDDASIRKQCVDAAFRAFTTQVETIVNGDNGTTIRGIETALLIPDQKILTIFEYANLHSRHERRDEVHLVPSLATFGTDDPRYRVRVAVGLGIAGLAYATNRALMYDRASYQASSGDGGYSPPSPYLQAVVDGRSLGEHSRLFTWPMTHKSAPDLPVGCICVGAIDGNEDFHLSESAFLGIGIEVCTLLRKLATEFNLARLMS